MPGDVLPCGRWPSSHTAFLCISVTHGPTTSRQDGCFPAEAPLPGYVFPCEHQCTCNSHWFMCGPSSEPRPFRGWGGMSQDLCPVAAQQGPGTSWVFPWVSSVPLTAKVTEGTISPSSAPGLLLDLPAAGQGSSFFSLRASVEECGRILNVLHCCHCCIKCYFHMRNLKWLRRSSPGRS